MTSDPPILSLIFFYELFLFIIEHLSLKFCIFDIIFGFTHNFILENVVFKIKSDTLSFTHFAR